LFAPAPAVRLRPSGFTGTPFPKDEPAAPNPPSGANIDYVLASEPAQPVTLTIRDAQGGVVRKYSSTDVPPAVDLARIGSAPEWIARPVTLAATPGLHRFVWPMRYAAPGRGAFADGVWAPPGRYIVELQVDGRSVVQPLELRADPRVSVPADAYAAEFVLARRIEATHARVAQAAESLAALQRALPARLATAAPAEAPLLKAFAAKLAAVSGTTPATNPSNAWWRPGRALTSLRYLNETLNTLEEAVDGADAAPSPDARDGYAKIEALVPPVLAAAASLRGPELSDLNANLKQAGAAPLP
jgi:hypothetical protein